MNLALLFHGGPLKITLTVPLILFFHFLFLFLFVVRVKQCVDLCVDMYTTNLLYESKGNKDYSKLELNVNNKILEVATFFSPRKAVQGEGVVSKSNKNPLEKFFDSIFEGAMLVHCSNSPNCFQVCSFVHILNCYTTN